jgi:hypothetical protein
MGNPLKRAAAANGVVYVHAGFILRGFRERLFLSDSDDVARSKIRRLVDKSYNHWGTRQYDRFQHSSNGIMP